MRSHWKWTGLLALALSSAPAWAEVTATEAWVRSTIGNQKATAAFLKLRSSEDAKLVGAASPAANIVEVHEIAMKDNVMSMRAVDEIALPAGKTVELRPGGYHVMLIDVVKPLAVGEEVPITLTIVGKDGKKSSLAVKAEVRSFGGTPVRK